MSKVICGKEHVLVMTDSREAYTWGANDRGQLGMTKQSTQKTISFNSYSYEDRNESERKSKVKTEDESHQINDSGKASESDEDSKEPLKLESKILVTSVKKVQKHYHGVPYKLSSIQGKIENISCGDFNSFAVVKL